MADIQFVPQASTIPAPAIHTFEIVQVDHYNADNKVIYLKFRDTELSERDLVIGVSLYQGEVDHVEYGTQEEVLQNHLGGTALN